MTIKRLIGFLIFTHLISILWLSKSFNQLISVYQVQDFSIINLMIILISLIGHLLGISMGSRLFEFLNNRIRFKVKKVLVLKPKSNLFISSYFLVLLLQFAFYIKHFGGYIIAESVDIEFLVGNISPLFPGQIGLFFLTVFSGIIYSRIYGLRFMFIICLFASFFLLKKYLLLLGCFYLIYTVSKKMKLVLAVSILFLYALIDSFRTNTEGISFQFRPDNYFSVSMINFIEMWDKEKFSKDYLYQFRAFIGGDYVENIDFPEPSSGPGYVGSLFVNGNMIYGFFWAILMGIYFFYLNYRCNKSDFSNNLLSPLFLFALFMTLQGNVFLNPILFVLPLFVIMIFSKIFTKKDAV
jgi:hypothetical protein